MGERAVLPDVAAKLRDALNPGGYLLMAHANAVVDDPHAPGFNWNVPYGARCVAETFEALPDLSLVSELSTPPLYRIQLFERPATPGLRTAAQAKRIRLQEQPTGLRLTRPRESAGTVVSPSGTKRSRPRRGCRY